ncbi:MAG: helix-turn-helix domain-containing protein [Tenuifilaceae bacterium]|jgi:excisionase family DNA binding protein|nr:helix-turn-helix domain-containing protein [Tenuifilaceae bacterium]
MDEKMILFPYPETKLKELISNCVAEAMNKHKEEENPRKYTIAEAAEYLGVSKPTLHNYKKNKRLRFSQVGKKVWILESELKRFVRDEPGFKNARK